MTFTQEHDDKFSSKWVNLAEERLGAKVLFATDDFFAEKENLIKPGRGIFIEDKFTDHGKWMDGWESRRKRVEGHDYAIIKLGLRGVIKGVDIDTNHFTGNHPPHASVEACSLKDSNPDKDTKWTEILPKQNLGPGSQHLFEIDSDQEWTHVRLHIYPDGGVARFRVYGEVKADWSKIDKSMLIDLVSVENEGRPVLCSDMYFSHMDNINAPGRGVNMGDGWETKRKREPGHDWIILALGKKGSIKKVLVDTAHFKGNYPASCSFEVASLELGQKEGLEKVEWKELRDKKELFPDQEHVIDDLNDVGPVTHIKLNIFPDGGISRLRVYGHIE
ncbi:MAG: allantoicase [Halobacteriovorax sp.]|nr:allantoicase [Halobacteriovorax sp.]